ncbi:hypothetical protein GQ55_1G097800 [Panicum hallii var. hallii]|uniref:Uncharacterized protein n=1 Tax=Panicum hallii var. hallii TaxID=1504633 RepID=A0A2T7F424_9POAL|nr:hypothetical protein GQ55_1G097800 [Panicum hallii var. hallii]
MKRINGGLLNHANEQNQSPVDHAAAADRTHSPSPVPFIPHYSFVWLFFHALDTCLFHATSKTIHPGSDHP